METQSHIKNPVTALREELSLNRMEFSRKFGLSYNTVSRCESGANISLSRPLWDVFVRLGRDPQLAEAQYNTWRAYYSYGGR